jgi:hypothetical protein
MQSETQKISPFKTDKFPLPTIIDWAALKANELRTNTDFLRYRNISTRVEQTLSDIDPAEVIRSFFHCIHINGEPDSPIQLVINQKANTVETNQSEIETITNITTPRITAQIFYQACRALSWTHELFRNPADVAIEIRNSMMNIRSPLENISAFNDVISYLPEVIKENHAREEKIEAEAWQLINEANLTEIQFSRLSIDQQIKQSQELLSTIQDKNTRRRTQQILTRMRPLIIDQEMQKAA